MNFSTEKIYLALQKNVKILLIIIATLILAIVLLLIFRPRKQSSLPNSAYKTQLDSLNHEIYVLQEMKKVMERDIQRRDEQISALQSRDSILVTLYAQREGQLKNIKTTYEKKRLDINKYGSTEIKRAFSELTDDD